MSERGRAWLGAAGLILGALVLIALTWFGTTSAVGVDRQEARARVAAEVSNQALLFESQFRLELLAIDQTLRILEQGWEADPAGFDLQDWRQRATVLPDIALHVFLTDEHGIIRSSTRPELVGVDVSGRDYFRFEAMPDRDHGNMFIGPATRGLVTNRWQMNMARRLDRPAGIFAGVIVVSYDTGALTRFYRQVDLGERGMIALVGAEDGRLRALVGPTAAEPGLDISRTPMFDALRAHPSGRWIGPSAPDQVRRIHAFRRVPNRELAVVLAYDADTDLGSSMSFRKGAYIFAFGTTLFIVILTGALLRGRELARRRERALDRDRAVLAAANAELEAARTRADAKTAQLEATLAGMSDGVSMLDAELNLVAWNSLFSGFTGVPEEMLHVGLPMEEILRTQAQLGEFGPVNVEKEVARRMALLRVGGSTGTVERARPGGRTMELRRSALPGGGFVTLYNDITARKRAEDAMRRAREMAEAATEAKSRFVATVSHEIRTPLNTLLNSLRLLSDTEVSAGQRRLVDMARGAGDNLLGLINDILEMSKMEAGRLALRPSLFAIRPLLEGVLQLFQDQAALRGMTLWLEVAENVPELIQGDSGRIRQVLTNLLSNAVKFASPGTVRLLAELRRDAARPLLRLAVRDPGPALSPEERARLFQPFSRLDRPQSDAVPGTGLGLAISQGLAALMQAEIGCEIAPDGGNEFWLGLAFNEAEPDIVLEAPTNEGCALPRTRILLVEDSLANQAVTATMLRREGHLVDLARTGEAAIDMVARAPYDFVLMDVFMPGIGGLEATRRIRSLPGPAGSLPVVALTANVAPEDHARCLRAGMSDMLGKPIELANLTEVIRKHVWPGCPTRSPRIPDVAASPDPALRTLARDRIAELRANLDPATLADLAEDCLVELRQRMPELRRALQAGDAAAAARQAHTMTGLAAGYGLSALEQGLRAVTTAAQRGAPEDAQAAAIDLEDELGRAVPALRAALRTELVGEL